MTNTKVGDPERVESYHQQDGNCKCVESQTESCERKRRDLLLVSCGLCIFVVGRILLCVCFGPKRRTNRATIRTTWESMVTCNTKCHGRLEQRFLSTT